ncbi:MAG: hypothetical protein NT069_12795, partial [Planctomycetota bacterium]|nr:hypothetical protein [Planctomycetota bacterium]
SQVSTSIGSDSTIHAGEVVIAAQMTSHYAPSVNSINASIAGASGAEGHATVNTSASSTVGTGSVFVATGVVGIGSRNSTAEVPNVNAASVNDGNSAYAGAGGVITGDAAGMTATVTGAAKLTIEDSVSITSGVDPVQKPGGIELAATSTLSANDQVLLSTGGLIEGGGTNSTITGTLTNDLEIGDSVILTSWGDIGVGTASTVDVHALSHANSGGLAGSADAHATAKIETDQTVAIGSDTQLTAFGDVVLSAGNGPRGTGQTILTVEADAQAYSYGVVDIPTADATASIKSQTTVTVADGTSIQSGQNVVVSAESGLLNGIESTTKSWNNSNAEPSVQAVVGVATESVTLNGTIAAGVFHEVTVSIPNDRTGGDGFSSTITVTASGPAALRPGRDDTFTPDFLPADYVGEQFTGSAAALLTSGVSSDAKPVGAVTLGSLFASGGTVSINGDSLSGSGSITAYGGPTITVTNSSPDYVLLGSMEIPNIPGGYIYYNTQSQTVTNLSGIGLTRVTPGRAPTITVQQTYTGPVGDSAYGPALFLTGNIVNLGGTVSITNEDGSFAQSATIYANRVNISSPQGVTVIQIPDGTYFAGGNPYSEWSGDMIWPGGNPAYGIPSADIAVSYAANAIFNSSGSLSSDAFDKALYGVAGNTAPNNNSTVFVGDSVPFDNTGGDDSTATNANWSKRANGPSGVYKISTSTGDGDQGYLPILPTKQTTTTASYSSANTSGSQASSSIYSSQVAIIAET